MSKMWKEKILRLLAPILVGALLAICPSGYANAASQSGQNSSSYKSSVRERIKRARELNKAKEKEKQEQSSTAGFPAWGGKPPTASASSMWTMAKIPMM